MSRAHYDDPSVRRYASVDHVISLPANDEDALKWAVATAGPVSVVMEAIESFVHYTQTVRIFEVENFAKNFDSETGGYSKDMFLY